MKPGNACKSESQSITINRTRVIQQKPLIPTEA